VFFPKLFLEYSRKIPKYNWIKTEELCFLHIQLALCTSGLLPMQPWPNTVSITLLMGIPISWLNPLLPVALSKSEQSRSIADHALNLRVTSWRLVSLEGACCGGGNLSCSRCKRQLPCILIGIMYHWVSATICGPHKSQLIQIGRT